MDPELAPLDPGPAIFTPEVQASRREYVRSRVQAALGSLREIDDADDPDTLAAAVSDALIELGRAEVEIMRAHLG